MEIIFQLNSQFVITNEKAENVHLAQDAFV